MKALSPILLTLFFLNSGYANQPDEAWKAYLAGDFEKVWEIVTEAFTDTSLSNTELAALFLALGCSDAMIGRPASASAAFEHALTLDPTISLTSDDLPPPVWEVFAPLQQRASNLNRNTIIFPSFSDNLELNPIPDTIRVPSPVFKSKSSTAKSLLFPGWGHLSENKKRGYLFLGIETIALTGFIFAAIRTQEVRNEYLNAREIPLINSKYSDYNKSYQLTWGLGITALTCYLYTQFDFFSSKPPPEISYFRSDHGVSEIGLSFKL